MLVFESVQDNAPMNVHHKYKIMKEKFIMHRVDGALLMKVALRHVKRSLLQVVTLIESHMLMDGRTTRAIP